jgi:hypothetical protein
VKCSCGGGCRRVVQLVITSIMHMSLTARACFLQKQLEHLNSGKADSVVTT